MRILFVVFPEPGHLNPLLGVMQHVAAGGHAVEVMSMEDLGPRLAAAGLAVRCHVAGEQGERNPARARDFAAKLARPAFARRWYEYVLVSQVPAQLAVLRDAIATFRPDAIATDPLAYAGALAAEQHGVPWASISTQLLAIAPPDLRCAYLDHLDALAEARARVFGDTAVRIVAGEALSPRLATVFATDALVPSGVTPRAICVGPSSPRGPDPAFPWERLRGDRPLVYAAFGTQLAPPRHVFEAIIDATRDAQLVLAYGDPDALPPLPDHVVAVRWAPQRALLAKAACAIIHGGASSFAEALAAGTPMLVIPIGHEQPIQAALAERCGVGRALAPADVTAERVAQHVRELAGDGPIRRRAAELQRSYAVDGARRAAELVVGLTT